MKKIESKFGFKFQFGGESPLTMRYEQVYKFETPLGVTRLETAEIISNFSLVGSYE